ncbi:MAG TPA: glycine zipper 2TM domain-containing protein [Burkholderiales bacterium]|nr:glycine zipper 2TM domain-containing protein [Burkholderiales bacterium]
MMTMENKNGMLYPLMILAAISVIIFSVVGIATMTGQVPNAFSSANRAEPVAARQGQVPGVTGAQPAASSSNKAAQSRNLITPSDCSNCGVIESIREVEVKGQGTGVGMAVGGVAGGLLGNQIGHGGGRTVATIAGAAGGAYVGNEVEKNQRSQNAYRITVRMEDGTYRTVTQRNAPGYGVGERVKLVDGAIVARS